MSHIIVSRNILDTDGLPLVVNQPIYTNPMEFRDDEFALDWVNANLEKTPEGWIAYRRQRGFYPPPSDWIFEPLRWLTVSNLDKNPNRDCSSGVHAATLEWLKKEYFCDLNLVTESQVWKVLIPNDATIVVPYSAGGKFRCNKIQLLEKVEGLL